MVVSSTVVRGGGQRPDHPQKPLAAGRVEPLVGSSRGEQATRGATMKLAARSSMCDACPLSTAGPALSCAAIKRTERSRLVGPPPRRHMRAGLDTAHDITRFWAAGQDFVDGGVLPCQSMRARTWGAWRGQSKTAIGVPESGAAKVARTRTRLSCPPRSGRASRARRPAARTVEVIEPRLFPKRLRALTGDGRDFQTRNLNSIQCRSSNYPTL